MAIPNRENCGHWFGDNLAVESCYVYAVKIKIIHIRYRNHSYILDLAGILNFVFQVKFNLIRLDDGHSYL
jgi:hypothetical protein